MKTSAYIESIKTITTGCIKWRNHLVASCNKLIKKNQPIRLDLSNQSVPPPFDDWEDNAQSTAKVEYHHYPLPVETIILVDKPESFKRILNEGFQVSCLDVTIIKNQTIWVFNVWFTNFYFRQNINIIGIDCEWKPSFGGQSNELALMQIATRNCVFVIDIVSLGGQRSLWQELSRSVFNNCDILKLGTIFT